MATLFVTEFSNVAAIGSRVTPVAPMPPLAEQTVAIGAASAQSAAFSATTNLIRVTADSNCSIEIGANPTASATTARLAAGAVEYFAVNPGAKIAVINAAGSANPAAIVANVQTATLFAAALPPQALVNGVVLTANAANVGTIYVGPAGVTTANGYPLTAGQSISYGVQDVSAIYMIGVNTTDVLNFTGN